MKSITSAGLLKAALYASKHAYAPYSRYRVGAALLAADGTVFTGCNVENSSYGLTICAERNAISAAIAAGKRKFKAMAIVASGRRKPIPCGACRQVLSEFCSDIPIYFAVSSTPSKFGMARSSHLLPESFRLN